MRKCQVFNVHISYFLSYYKKEWKVFVRLERDNFRVLLHYDKKAKTYHTCDWNEIPFVNIDSLHKYEVILKLYELF